MDDLLTTWGSFYADHAVMRTIVAFAHTAALVTGGGVAIAADRATLHAVRGGISRNVQLDILHETHGLVVTALAVIALSGGLMFAADFEAFFYSRLFWSKMALTILLLANGALLWFSERRARRGEDAAWTTLRMAAIISIVLWLLITLVGVTLPNMG